MKIKVNEKKKQHKIKTARNSIKIIECKLNKQMNK